MDNDLAKLLGDMRGDLGRIEGKLDAHKESFDRHLQQDMEAYKVIGQLKQEQARMRGFLAGVGSLGGLLGAAATYLFEHVFGGHS
jgi:hypothetical protein